MKHLLPSALVLLALATPATAIPESAMSPQWDRDVSRAMAKLKVGMDAIQAQNQFATIEPKAKMDEIDYRSKIVQVFMVAGTKERYYLNMNFYMLGNNQTKHAAAILFKAPRDDFRGPAAKVVRWGLVEGWKYRIYDPVPTLDVKTPDEIDPKLRFKI